MSECLTFRISVRRGNKTNRSSAKAIKRSHDRGSRVRRAAGPDQDVFKAIIIIQQKSANKKRRKTHGSAGETHYGRGRIRPGGILKVDGFLNHRIDPQLSYDMAVELKRLYEETEINKILIIDDFLATGAALKGLGLEALVEQAGGTVAGAGIAIERAFQGGGDEMRREGMRVESLTRIASMTDDSIEFVRE